MSADPYAPQTSAKPTTPLDPGTRPAARFRYDVAEERWWWSTQTYHLHGFEPHEIVPTTALVLAHKHPEDRSSFRDLLETATRTGAPFTATHRIMTAQGRERVVCVAGQGRLDPETGAVVELMGYFADQTEVLAALAERLAGEHIRAASAHRGTIEQAKGALSAVYDMGVEEAFALLRRTSNDHNIPVRTLADRVIDLIRNLPSCEQQREVLDELLQNPGQPSPRP